MLKIRVNKIHEEIKLAEKFDVTLLNKDLDKAKNKAEKLIENINSHDGAEVYKEFEQILTRGEAVRFAPVSSQDAQNDMQKIKDLLKKVDHVW